MHFISSCELLVGRYLFWACFALLHSFCFGAVEGLVTKYCDCRKGSSGVWSVVFLSSTCRSPSSPFVFPCAVFHLFCWCSLEPCVCDFHARLSCATLFHPRFLHYLKVLKGFRFQSPRVWTSDGWRTKLSHSCGDHSSSCRVGTWPVVCQLVWVFLMQCAALSLWYRRPVHVDRQSTWHVWQLRAEGDLLLHRSWSCCLSHRRAVCRRAFRWRLVRGQTTKCAPGIWADRGRIGARGPPKALSPDRGLSEGGPVASHRSADHRDILSRKKSCR